MAKAVAFFEKYELYCIALFVLVVLLNALMEHGLSVLIVSLASTFAVFYFFSAFKPVPANSISQEVLFVMKLAGMSAALSMVGMQFTILGWKSGPMIVGGMLTSVACVLFAAVYKKKVTDAGIQNYFKRVIYRGIFFGSVCALFYFTPKEKLVELGLRTEHADKPGEGGGNN